MIRDEEVHVQGGAGRVPQLGAGGTAGDRAGDTRDSASRPLPNQKGKWFYRAARPKVPQIMAMSVTRAVRPPRGLGERGDYALVPVPYL